ncbi:MAG: ribosome maturation factor RimP [Actinomycetota bacterium]|nr:ribosome maturation factor RimP [Actinomycetota bacterium]
MAVADRVTEIVTPLLDPLGVDLVDVEHASGRLRVTVDQQGGIDTGALTEATKVVSRALDEHDPVPGRYTLEVSSPGLERPLRTPAHFERAIGEEVALRLVAGVEGDRRVRGVLRSVSGDVVVVSVGDDDERHDRTIDLADVDRARTVFEWGPAPKPGKGPKRTKKSKAAAKKQSASEGAAAAPTDGAPTEDTSDGAAATSDDAATTSEGTSASDDAATSEDASTADDTVTSEDAVTSNDDETTRAS